jgi:sugar lactone lactonase YvrE
LTTELLLDGLVFPEGPRWKDGKLWFSDAPSKRVLTVDLAGMVQTIHTLTDDTPSGLGFMPDGSLLVVSQHKRQLLRLGEHGVSVHAELSEFPGDHLNDMAVDARGRAYVGMILRTGDETQSKPVEQERRCGSLILVTPDGCAQVVERPLHGVNGTIVTPDQKTLIVAETRAHSLTAYDIERDGSLSNRRDYAHTDGCFPDGIALDLEGAIWIVFPHSFEFLRIAKGGGVLERISLRKGTWGTACALGGPERRTLFMCIAETSRENRKVSRGRIEATQVSVPGV